MARPWIVFLNYSIVNDTIKGEYKVHLINKVISDGMIKQRSGEPQKPGINDLEYMVLDNNSQVLQYNIIENPLNKTVEFVNDTGQLGKKEIKLDSALFSIRIQIDPAAESIVLKRYTGNQRKSIHLITTNLHESK